MIEFNYKNGKIINGDCLEIMDKLIELNIKVDCIIADLPYNTTACDFDKNIIDLCAMWDKLKRLVKSKNTPIVLFGAMPFTAKLVNSNLKGYKHHWIWKKNRGTGFQVAKYRPMMATEDILAFTINGDKINYNPQKIKLDKPVTYRYSSKTQHCDKLKKTGTYIVDEKYPTNILEFSNVNKSVHPTQKPVELLEYLLKTYSNDGDIVLDITAGSCSLGIACLNTNRKFIGIEKDEKYFNIAKERILNSIGDNND